jgi:hypothetical protein
MQEIWKDVPNYEGMYQVSNLGSVKSLDRIVYEKNGECRLLKGKYKSKTLNNKGYFSVGLSKDSVVRYFTVHKLVAMAFLNHTPCGHKLVVDHIDNKPSNNKLENLQLITHRENLSKDKVGSSKYTGVCWNKNAKKWGCSIRIKGKVNFLGYFDNEYDAYLEYQKKLKEIC